MVVGAVAAEAVAQRQASTNPAGPGLARYAVGPRSGARAGGRGTPTPPGRRRDVYCCLTAISPSSDQSSWSIVVFTIFGVAAR
ncbi:hypothetical protein GCM10018787_30380 [Streptomyces thermodiastaticus]|nr:hypothetical protein GCM10018787_30380 [Streptomyces thermodiastaticus]